MAEINHEIKVHAAPSAVSNALTNPSELGKWHTAGTKGIAGKAEVFMVHPQDGPVFEWKIIKSGGDTVEWQCISGPGDAVGTSAVFRVSPLSDGRTLIEFSHSGWPDTKGNFRKCNTLWAVLLFHLQKYLDTHQTAPAFN